MSGRRLYPDMAKRTASRRNALLQLRETEKRGRDDAAVTAVTRGGVEPGKRMLSTDGDSGVGGLTEVVEGVGGVRCRYRVRCCVSTDGGDIGEVEA